MVRRLKWIGLYISLLFVVLSGLVVSPKAKAVDLSVNVSYLGSWNLGYGFMAGSGSCNYTNTGTTGYVSATGICSPYMYMIPQGNLAFNKDYIIGVTVYIYETRDREPENGYANGAQELTITNNGQTWKAQHIGTTYERISESASAVNMYFKLDNGVSGTQYLNTSSRLSFALRLGIQPNEYLTASGAVAILASMNPSFDNAGMIDAINNLRTSNQNWLAQINQNIQELRQAIIDNRSSINNIDNSVQNIENNFEQQEQQAQQDGQQSQDDANQSGQDVEGSTTNLISAITGFFGAFTSASATTCQTDWGIEGFRNFDFCGTQIPTALRVVFTIVASIIFIPMIWFLINSILSAFKEFQQ